MAKTTTAGATPRLRFPEFQHDGAWELVPLKDLSEPITDKVGHARLTPVSISAGRGFVAQAEKFGRDISGAQYEKYIRLKRGDFAYNRGNSKVYPQGCVYRLKEFDEAAASNAFYCFRLGGGNAPGFFEGLFEKNAHGPQLTRHLSSGARSNGLLNIGAEAFFGVRLPIPPLTAEQRKIADCLTSLDDVIAAQARKVEALKTHKRGLMQQLFPREGETVPRLRFPEFGGRAEWKHVKLDEIAKRGSGHTPSRSKPEYYNGGVKWVSLADSKRLDNGYISETSTLISEAGIANSSAVLHSAGSVVLCRDAAIGRSAILKEPMAVSQHFMVWTCNEKRLSNWFLYYTLQCMRPMFERVASGSTILTIGLPFFAALRVSIPTIPEQKRIAGCLRILDDQIAAESERLDVLRSHKVGLMQQLFPSPDLH